MFQSISTSILNKSVIIMSQTISWKRNQMYVQRIDLSCASSLSVKINNFESQFLICESHLCSKWQSECLPDLMKRLLDIIHKNYIIFVFRPPWKIGHLPLNFTLSTIKMLRFKANLVSCIQPLHYKVSLYYLFQYCAYQYVSLM